MTVHAVVQAHEVSFVSLLEMVLSLWRGVCDMKMLVRKLGVVQLLQGSGLEPLVPGAAAAGHP